MLRSSVELPLFPTRWRVTVCGLVAAITLLSGGMPLSAGDPGRKTGSIQPDHRAQIPYYMTDSGREGPVVMIVGGVHGDEPAGAAAANQIRHWPVTRGRLIVVPGANPEALAASSRTTPTLGKDLANLNRNFPSTRPEDSPRGRQAEAIWRFVQDQRPEWLIDLHEGAAIAQLRTGSAGSSIIAFPSDETLQAAALMLEAVNATIDEKDKAFVQRGSPIGGSLARAAAVQLGIRSMIVETTKRDQPVSLRTRQHRIMVHRLLRHLDMLPDVATPERITPFERTAGDVFLALYDAGGSAGQGVPRMLEILGSIPGMHVERVGPPDIRAGVLEQFDAVAFCGGSGSGQAKALGDEGRRQVRQFVDQGGGYIGICAGSYLACSGFSWGLSILDARAKSPLWRRGKGTVRFEATDTGAEILGLGRAGIDVHYANGPVLELAHADDIPDFTPLALFTTEMADNGTPQGIMAGSPAAVAGRYGRGRVLCFSPHPEQTPGLENCVLRAVRWVARRDGAARNPPTTRDSGSPSQ